MTLSFMIYYRTNCSLSEEIERILLPQKENTIASDKTNEFHIKRQTPSDYPDQKVPMVKSEFF